MPGVLLDEQNYPLDSMQPSSFYESLAAFSPPVSHSQAQLMRNNSFSGSRDTSSSLSHSAPIYHRSQSAISSSALHGFSNFFSPPTTPKKSDNGFSGGGSDVGEDMSNLNGDNGDVLVGLNGASASSPLSMSSSSHHREFQADLRTFFGGNSSIVGPPTVDSPSALNNKYLPSNDEDDTWGSTVVDVYACDQFRMFEFKVRRCMRGRSHDWTECPFAHPGEKARRRDPRRFHYSGTACPDFRKGSCRRGDACEFAHGVFECWLHPARYRTQPCKDGRNCRRRVCFFAHTPEQLRLLPAAAQAANAAARSGGSNFALATPLPQLSGSYDGSPVRNGVSFDGAYGYDSSSTGCVSHCPPSPHGSCQNGSVHGGCNHFDGSIGGNASAHNGHCCASPHMSSPTSTLVGHTPSPPPLSPPLSPSGSPPMSPQSPHHWPNSPGAKSLSCPSPLSSLQAQTACIQASLQASMTHQLGGYSQGPSSPLSRGINSQQAMSAAVAAAAHSHQTPSLTPPAHRRHLDRLNSMPTLSIPQVDHSHRGMLQNVSSPLSSPSSCSPPSHSASSMNELIAQIQQLNLHRGSAIPLWVQAQQAQGSTQSANQYSSGPSPLRRCSQSVPCTPTKLRWEDRNPRWEVDDNEEVEPPVQRVESGRDLRAKIYGRLGKENRMEAEDVPDLGWVNELVKDEQQQRPNGGW